MSDGTEGTSNPHPGSLSPQWDANTYEYEVLLPLPQRGFALPVVGEKFKAWNYGETFVWWVDRGPILKRGDVGDWLEAGLIRKLDPKAAEKPLGARLMRKAVAEPVREG